MLFYSPTFVLAALAIALLLDMVFGGALRRLLGAGAPDRLAARFLALLERAFYRGDGARFTQRFAGAIATALLCVAALAVTLALSWLAAYAPFEVLTTAALLAPLLRGKATREQLEEVATALDAGLPQARRAAATIADGRDFTDMKQTALARLSVEAASGGYADDVAGPLFWGLVAGLPGAVLYKAFDWCDAAYGFRSSRLRWFGWAAARLASVAAWIPARLGALYLAGGAAIAGGGFFEALHVAARDHLDYVSVNKGWLVGAAAGAFGLRLFGPRRYGKTLVEAPWIGSGRAEVSANDLRLLGQALVNADLLALGSLAGLWLGFVMI